MYTWITSFGIYPPNFDNSEPEPEPEHDCIPGLPPCGTYPPDLDGSEPEPETEPDVEDDCMDYLHVEHIHQFR